MPNVVQGVQGVVQGVVQGQTLTARGLCRVCRGFPYVTRARERSAYAKIKNKSRIYICTLHTLHTLHRSRISCPCDFSHPAHLPAHPAQILFFLIIKIMKWIVGPENARSIQEKLKTELPDFHDLVKQCYAAGLISGLRGLTLETDLESPAQPVAIAQTSAQICAQCRYFEKDLLGDGSGLGQCEKSVKRSVLLWPGQNACYLFQESP